MSLYHRPANSCKRLICMYVCMYVCVRVWFLKTNDSNSVGFFHNLKHKLTVAQKITLYLLLFLLLSPFLFESFWTVVYWLPFITNLKMNLTNACPKLFIELIHLLCSVIQVVSLSLSFHMKYVAIIRAQTTFSIAFPKADFCLISA